MRLLVSFVVFSLSSGCFLAALLFPYDELDRAPTPAELEGLWTLSEDSLEIMVIDGYEPKESEKIRLFLHADGSCSIGWVNHQLAFEDFSGSWTVRHQPDRTHRTAMTFGNPGHFTDARHRVARDGDDLVIWTYWGDPDAGLLLSYYKK